MENRVSQFVSINEKKGIPDNPLVSIILPSLRPSQLAQCLASIERYTVGIDYEVVVVSPFDIEPHSNVVHVRGLGLKVFTKQLPVDTKSLTVENKRGWHRVKKNNRTGKES